MRSIPARPPCLTRFISYLVPSSSTWFQKRRPTKVRPDTFCIGISRPAVSTESPRGAARWLHTLTVQKSIDRRMTTSTVCGQHIVEDWKRRRQRLVVAPTKAPYTRRRTEKTSVHDGAYSAGHDAREAHQRWQGRRDCQMQLGERYEQDQALTGAAEEAAEQVHCHSCDPEGEEEEQGHGMPVGKEHSADTA